MTLQELSPPLTRRFGGRVALTHAIAVLAPTVTIVLLCQYLMRHALAIDFRAEYWVAAGRVLDGKSPYLWSPDQISSGVSFPYPAVTAVLLGPFGLLSQGTSAAVFVAILMAAAGGTLWVLEVRDWRVYAVTPLLAPVITAWQSGNVTLLLGLLIALTWRYRDKPMITGLLVALTISLKPFTWPLGLWLLATGRPRAIRWACAGGLLGNAAAWAVLGYGQIGAYFDLDARTTRGVFHRGYSLVSVVARIGASEAMGVAVLALASACVGIICIRLARRRRDDAALAVSVGLMLAASPLVHNHYFALLIVPLAIMRPRLSREWLVMLLLWLCPAMQVSQWQALLAASVTVAVLASITSAGGSRPGPSVGREEVERLPRSRRRQPTERL